jgi:uncharacterized protein YggU (UPF0235/DUF167 family)
MSCIIEVRVVPNAGKQYCILDKAGRLKCYLVNQPEKGLANKELVTLLAKALGVPQAQVTIIAGATGRTKYVRIPIALSHEELLQKLGIPKQMRLCE